MSPKSSKSRKGFTQVHDRPRTFNPFMVSITETLSLSNTVHSRASTMSLWVRSTLCYDCHLLKALTCPQGITKSIKQDWIRIDRNYLGRIAQRKKLVAQHPEICVGISEKANPAVRELYEEVILDLLPKRFPSMFRIKGDFFHNLATGTRHRVSSALLDHTSMLRHLAENVEEDFVFMVPDVQDEFVLQGFISCFPQGFLPSARVGMSVSEIHKPVPGYEGRLKKGVKRCFERMERGQSVGRLNVGSSQIIIEREKSKLTERSGQFRATTPNYFSHSRAQIPITQTTVHPQGSTLTRWLPFCVSNITLLPASHVPEPSSSPSAPI